jgi:Kdo2-lipid IVA lauroyltransferase/acyltransferase
VSRRRKSAILQWLEYLLYRAVASSANRASDRSIFRWGTRLGRLARRLLRRRDRLAMRNLRATFPQMDDAQRRRILDACWQHFGRETLITIRMQNMPIEEILARCPLVNAHLLEQGIALGRGVILISAHYGGWEVGGLAVMAAMKDVRTITRPLDNEYLERDVARIRARTGAAVLDRRRAARATLKALSENAVVVMLPDQAVLPREGILVPFMGRKAWTTPAAAKMALRVGSTIVFTFCIPDANGHRLEFEQPIFVDQLSEDERNPEALTRRINDVISRRIESRPELWLWMHDRWKGTETGESEGMNGE